MTSVTSLKKIAYSFSLLLKTAAKEKLTRQQLDRQLKHNKKQYQSLKRNLDLLEADDSKLQGKLNQIRQDFQNSCSKLEQIRQSLENLNLTGAEHVSLYEDGTTGYFIGNKEYYAARTENGGISLIPMRVHRKKLREEKINSIPQGEFQQGLEENSDTSEDVEEDENELNQYWWEN